MLSEMASNFSKYIDPASPFWTWMGPKVAAKTNGQPTLNMDRFQNKGRRVVSVRRHPWPCHLGSNRILRPFVLWDRVMLQEILSVQDFKDLEHQATLTFKQRAIFAEIFIHMLAAWI